VRLAFFLQHSHCIRGFDGLHLTGHELVIESVQSGTKVRQFIKVSRHGLLHELLGPAAGSNHPLIKLCL
jgi:hypothetical protein